MQINRKIQISQTQRYSCQLCGRCCRRFHVLIRPEELAGLQSLDWGNEPDVPTDFHHNIHGETYFRRREDGSCVFLDEHGGCRMHRRFGFRVKALTCKGYPFNVVSTFPGEVSVLAHMDCPAVAQGHGTPIHLQRKDIEHLVSQLHFGAGFTESLRQGLSRPAIESICQNLRNILKRNDLAISQQIGFLWLLTLRCEQLGAAFLNDGPTMREVLPSMLSHLEEELQDLPRLGVHGLSRVYFRQWLTLYCRRDEEIVNPGLEQRLGGLCAVAKVVGGYGNLHALGKEHPDFPLRKAPLFDRKPGPPPPPETWEVYRRFLDVHLETFQFFGAAYYNQPFYVGLKALLLTYPLALASARIHAASNNREVIEQEDVLYAVMSIAHIHGRSPSLRLPGARHTEAYFAGKRFPRLLFDLGLH